MVEPLTAIRGQERAVALLRRYLSSGKVPQGLLLYGEEGIGKEKAAKAFVAALFCRRRLPDGACGTCPECRLLDSGNHPNLLRVEPETHSIPIEDIRALKEELSLKAFSDRPRAALIVPADRMTLQAANALLKTLEEPPPDTHLLLVAHRLSQVPPTIVSRCQKVPFSPLPQDEVEAILAGLPGVGKRHGPDAIRAAAACVGGSPGRALAVLGEMEEERETWVRLLSRLEPDAVFRTSEGWKRGAGEGAGSIAVPLSLLRDLSLLSSGGKAAIINEDLRDRLQAVAARKAPSGWIRAWQAMLALSRMPPQAQKRLMLEAFLFDLHLKG